MDGFVAFLDRKKREYGRAIARHVARKSPVTWRMRLRVRLLSRLNSDALELRTRFRGRRVIIRARAKGKTLRESDWLVFLARRFRSMEEAAEFGLALQSALSAIAAVRHIPIDVGADNKATLQTGDVVKEAAARKGTWLIDDVHGVDVYPDTQTAMIAFGDINVTTSLNPERLTEPLERVGKKLDALDTAAQEAALLINAAYMAPHPVAMVTLGVAAVELLAPKAQRTSAQREWIASARRQLSDNETLTAHEQEELRQAIDGLNHVSVLARTRRLFVDLGLVDLLPDWERLYKQRSRMFHGDRIVPFSELQTMGGDARVICHAVATAYIARRTGNLDLS